MEELRVVETSLRSSEASLDGFHSDARPVAVAGMFHHRPWPTHELERGLKCKRTVKLLSLKGGASRKGSFL